MQVAPPSPRSPLFYPPAPESHRLWLVHLAVLAVIGPCVPYPRCAALFCVRGKPRSSANPGAAFVALGAKAFQGADDFLGESIGLWGTTVDWRTAHGAIGRRGHVPSQALCTRCVATIRPYWNLKDAAADGTKKRRVRLMQQLRLVRSAAAHEDLRHRVDHLHRLAHVFSRAASPKGAKLELGRNIVRTRTKDAYLKHGLEVNKVNEKLVADLRAPVESFSGVKGGHARLGGQRSTPQSTAA